MGSNLKFFLNKNRTKHSVGNVTTSLPIRTFINGAKVVEDEGVDNYSLVELNYVNGVPEVKYATSSATAENVFLTVTPVQVLEQFGEYISDFYNTKGDLANIAYLPQGFSFQTSNMADVENVEVGNYVVWDTTDNTFVVKATPTSTDVKVFQVRETESEENFVINGLTLVELIVVR